jgi:hypothetical protein
MRYHPRMPPADVPVALGFRVKSGFAVAVAIAGGPAGPLAVDRRIVELSDPAVAETRQPYHAGAGTAREDEQAIARLTRIIHECARASIDSLLASNDLARCIGAGLVVGSVIDPATVGNPHIRAHASEGRLFRSVLEEALDSHGITCDVIVEKSLDTAAPRAIGRPAIQIRKVIGTLGHSLRGPWRAEEKAAATAAWMVLAQRSKKLEVRT